MDAPHPAVTSAQIGLTDWITTRFLLLFSMSVEKSFFNEVCYDQSVAIIPNHLADQLNKET
jgi:hypothetical protein